MNADKSKPATAGNRRVALARQKRLTQPLRRKTDREVSNKKRFSSLDGRAAITEKQITKRKTCMNKAMIAVAMLLCMPIGLLDKKSSAESSVAESLRFYDFAIHRSANFLARGVIWQPTG